MTSTSELLQFYGCWQMVVCFFAFLALISIWHHIGRKQKDLGQVFLALSILCWSLSGGIELFFASLPAHSNQSFQLAGWRSILSLCNSLFILLALPWFRYLPKQAESLIRSKYWRYLIGLPFLFALLPTISKMMLAKNLGLISELDVYYAVLTLAFLGFVLWETFTRRGLKGLAWLAVGCIMITLVAQLYKLTGSEINMTLLSAIFKTCLIMIFFALALSWVKEISEPPNLSSSLLTLVLHKIASGDKVRYMVRLSGVSKETQELELSPTHFDLLNRLAKARKESDQGWLEIKPRNAERGRIYDVNDHNEIKRLLHALLDGIYGQRVWSREKHEGPFKRALLEQGGRKVRLALAPERIQSLGTE